jgi:hypothetical protein
MVESEDRSARQGRSGAPFANVVPVEQMAGDDEEDSALLAGMAGQAAEYLMSFDWCVSIIDTYFGDGIGGVVAVFLFRILPARPDVDEWLWVVVGDLPFAYFDAENIKSPRAALDEYILQRSQWADCILAGRTPTAEVMPVNVDQPERWPRPFRAALRPSPNKFARIFAARGG